MTEQNLRSLPPGALFAARDGNIRVELRRSADTLLVSAHSDSIARGEEILEVRNARYSARLDSLQELNRTLRTRCDSLTLAAHDEHVLQADTSRTAPTRRMLWFALGVAAAAAIRILIRKIFNS